MQKEKLQNLINKYYLNKAGAESVLINFTDDLTSINFHSTDKTLLGEVRLNEGIINGEVGIFETEVFLKLLSAFNATDDIQITENKNKSNVITSLLLENDIAKVIATVADPQIIDKSGSLKQEIDFHYMYDLDVSFMDLFKRYQSATGAEYFAFDIGMDKTTVIMNYSNTNTNHIKFDIKANNPIDTNYKVCYKADKFLEIFNANRDCVGEICISNAGLCKIQLSNEDFNCTYYLVNSNI